MGSIHYVPSVVIEQLGSIMGLPAVMAAKGSSEGVSAKIMSIRAGNSMVWMGMLGNLTNFPGRGLKHPQ